jgi:hypothetical protein
LRQNEMFRSHVFTCCNWGAIGFGKCNLSENQSRQTQDKESTSCTLNGIHCNREKIGERLAQLTVVLPGFLYLGPNFQGEGKKWEGQMNISVPAPFISTHGKSRFFLFSSTRSNVFKPRHPFCLLTFPPSQHSH